MMNIIKTLLPILFIISCSGSVEKPDIKPDEKPTEAISNAPKTDPVLETKTAIEPELPERKSGLDLTGTWQLLQLNGTLNSSGPKFKFCKSGAASLIEGDVETKYEKFLVSTDQKIRRLLLFPAKGNPRNWLFRTLDSENIEVAEPKTCPANKRCYAPSFEHLTTLRFKRTHEHGCAK